MSELPRRTRFSIELHVYPRRKNFRPEWKGEA
jgi:hypothetical protein